MDLQEGGVVPFLGDLGSMRSARTVLQPNPQVRPRGQGTQGTGLRARGREADGVWYI